MFKTDSNLWVVSTPKNAGQISYRSGCQWWPANLPSHPLTPFFMDLAKQHVGSVDTSVRRHLRMFPKDGHGGVVVGQRFLQPNPTSRKLVPRHRPRECGGFTAWFAKTCSWWIRSLEIRKLWSKWRCKSEMTSFCSMLAQHFCPGVLLIQDVLMVDSMMIQQGWTSPPKHGFTIHSCFAHCSQAAEWVRKELLLRPAGSRDRCCGWSKHTMHTMTQLVRHRMFK